MMIKEAFFLILDQFQCEFLLPGAIFGANLI